MLTCISNVANPCKLRASVKQLLLKPRIHRESVANLTSSPSVNFATAWLGACWIEMRLRWLIPSLHYDRLVPAHPNASYQQFVGDSCASVR